MKFKKFQLHKILIVGVLASFIVWLELCAPAAMARDIHDGRIAYVNPSKIEIRADPGQTKKESFAIVNKTDAGIKLKISVKKLIYAENGGKLEFSFIDDQKISEWLIPKYKEVTVSARGEKQVDFLASIPENAQTGNYFGAILLERASDKFPGPKNHFGILVFLTVAGNASQLEVNAEITDFSTKSLQTKSPISINLSIKNSGSAYINGEGVIFVTGWRGQVVASVPTGEKIVYPGIERSFEWLWDYDLPAGFYKLGTELSDKNTRMQLASQSSWFLVAPKIYMLSALFIIGLALLAAVFNKRLGSYGRLAFSSIFKKPEKIL